MTERERKTKNKGPLKSQTWEVKRAGVLALCASKHVCVCFRKIKREMLEEERIYLQASDSLKIRGMQRKKGIEMQLILTVCK